MDDLMQEFLTETLEGISTLDGQIIDLEKNPNNEPLIASIFRLFHTIKGTCGFLSLTRLERVAHAAEDVLGMVRDGKLEVTPPIVSLILTSLDRIKMIIDVLEQTEAEPEGEDEDIIPTLRAVADGDLSVLEEGAAKPKKKKAAAKKAPAKKKTAAKKAKEETKEVAVAEEKAPTKSDAAAPAASAAPASGGAESSVASQSIRVSVGVLENLMTLVSELVLTRNQLLQLARNTSNGDKEEGWAVPLQHLSHVTSELQEGVMQTRMQPIGSAWGKLPRIIRDLSMELGKKIELQMIGAETELDRQVLDLIKDPLTHMVRNSADHGIEMPDERVEAGKPEQGRVTLNAFHEGGHIIIEISDDGKGLNLDRIKSKIIGNNLASEAEVANMTDQQIYQHIFSAGFSTAAAVTAVSGRGVGMDVVKTNIEKIGGTVSLNSAEGKGSTFTIKIPLTLAIISALIVEAGNNKFAIPQINVIELVSASGNTEHRLEMLNNSYVLRLRNRLLPLISLKKALQIDNEPLDLDKEHFIIVAQVGTYSFGLVVDQVFDTEEIVVKPVSPMLRHISLLSGSTILGDGSVIMILDPNGLSSLSSESQSDIASAQQNLDDQSQNEYAFDEKSSFLIFKAGDSSGHKAVPLSLVTRIENIDTKAIELNDTGRPMLQYRGNLMPLLTVDDNDKSFEDLDSKPVLVFSDEGRDIGLLVTEIVDICEEVLNVEYEDLRPGFLGRAVILGNATDVIDIGFFLSKVAKEWFNSESKQILRKKRDEKRVLLLDDSDFFHNLLTPLLNISGYRVTNAKSAAEALKLCENGEMFDIILSDIEMPEMDGFDFVDHVRKDTPWKNTPIVALSAHDLSEDQAVLKESGFDHYIAKLDREALIAALNEMSQLTGGNNDDSKGVA